MTSKTAHTHYSKAKENVCPKVSLINGTHSPILKKEMKDDEDITSAKNIGNSTPLRQTTLDSSLIHNSSPFTDKTANNGTGTVEAAAEEISCKPLTEQNHVEEVVSFSPARQATKQTTLTTTTHQITARKQTRSTKQKPGKNKSVTSRNRSVDTQFSETSISHPRSKAISVSPKKSQLKPASDTVPSEQATGKKHQTQLTYYGIRRTARQFAKDMQRERDVNIQECLRNNIEEGMKIIQTEEKGRGVIATRPFHDDEFIVEYAGELVSEKEAKRREVEYKKDVNIGSYMFYFMHSGQKFCVDATAETLRLGRLVNHSRLHPNCQVKTVPLDGVPRLALFAKRPILPDSNRTVEDLENVCHQTCGILGPSVYGQALMSMVSPPAIGEELLYDYGDRDKETLEAHPWLKT